MGALSVAAVTRLLNDDGRASGASAMLDHVTRRVVGAVPEDLYDGPPAEVYAAFTRDVQVARAAVHEQPKKVRIVSMSVLMHVLKRTCESWLCNDVAVALGLGTRAEDVLLDVEKSIVEAGRLTKDTLRHYLANLRLLLDLERHIADNRRDAHMMPADIRALGVAGFRHVKLERYLEVMRLTEGKTSRTALKRVFRLIE